MIQKIWTIIKSRFTKPKESKEIKRRREICLGCEYNSNNISKLSTYKSFLASLSTFYSSITGNKDEDTLGNCGVCGCSVYYKSLLEDECPHPKGDKWKRVNIKL